MTAIKIKQDGAWVRVPSLGVETFPDAPKDGVQYARKDGDWSKVETTGGSLDLSPLFTENGKFATSITQEYLDTVKAAYDKRVTSGHYGTITIPIAIVVEPELVSMSFSISGAQGTGIGLGYMTMEIVVADLSVVGHTGGVQLLTNGDGTKALMDDGTYKEIKVDLYETVKIRLTGNQPQPDESLNGAIIYVKYNEISIPLTWEGTELKTKLPLGVFYSVEPERVNGYSLPAKQNYTATPGDARSVLLYYNTQITTVTVETDDGKSVSGQTLTITNVADGSVIYTGEAGISTFNVPIGIVFKMGLDNKEGYLPIPYLSATARDPNVRYRITYEKIKSSTITINQTITDPVTMITGDINGIIIQQIRTESHRVLGKYTASGQMTICRLNDANGNQYHDGTAAALTGTEGDVFMRLPRFFYKAEQVSTDVWKVGFAMQALDSNWKEWDGKDIIGVYEAYSNQSKAFSRSGVASTGDVSQATWKTHARARGTGYTLVKHKHQNILAFLFYGVYGNTNAQAVCGAGTNDYQKNTGQTNALGMTDTTVVNGNAMSINFWGLENWWGDKYELVDNVIVSPVSDNGLWRIAEDDNTTRDVQGAATSGYLNKMIIGDHLDTIAKEYGASNTTGFCDYQYTSGKGTTRVVLRSCGYSSASGGVAFADASYDASFTYSYFGSRLAFRGEIIEESNVEAFKALPITN